MSISISSLNTLCSFLLLALVALLPQGTPATAETKGAAVTLLNCTGRAMNVKAYDPDNSKMVADADQRGREWLDDEIRLRNSVLQAGTQSVTPTRRDAAGELPPFSRTAP